MRDSEGRGDVSRPPGYVCAVGLKQERDRAGAVCELRAGEGAETLRENKPGSKSPPFLLTHSQQRR